MKLAPPPLAIGPDDGFEDTDLFDYKDFGERLTHIVEALDSATVIALDGPWGSGKTTFMQQWAGLLRKRGHAVVQFDAFANDYQDDAFVALAGALHASSKDKDSEGAEKLKASFLKSAAGVGKALPSIATRMAVNLVTQGALSTAAVSKLVESIESAHSSQLEKRIATAHKNSQVVEEFRHRLSELATELAKGTTTGPQESKPADKTKQKLVFIIDELDRCKPTFALSLLERMKHLFSVDEIVFVLVAHLAQLARMVQKEYGVDSGARYLEKFYHRQVRLPVHEQQSAQQRRKYLEHLWKSMRVRNDEPRILQLVTEGLGKLAEVYDLPLRTLERVAGSVVLVWVATHSSYFRFAPLISGLCVMRIVDPDTYEKARTGRLSTHEAMQFLRFEDWNPTSVGAGSIDWHKDGWIYATASDDQLQGEKYGKSRDFGQLIWKFNVSRRDMIKITCECIEGLWQREPV